MFLLDTNVISELRRPEKANPHVVHWSKHQDPGVLFLSVISILEVERGALLLDRRDRQQASMLLRWLENSVIPAFSERILPVDIFVARRCATLHVPDPRAGRDSFIAATALVHGFTVVTRNVRDFEPMGVPTLNPWTAPQGPQ
jgi:predicted nucleic acid-binding protein